MSELDGFTVFRPQRGASIHITVRNRVIGITKDAVAVLGEPKEVNVFLDERRRRVMIKSAEAGFDNTLKICKNGRSGLMITSAILAKKLGDWWGEGAQIPGHTAGDGILIFEVRK